MTTPEVTMTNNRIVLPAAIALGLATIPNLALAADDTSSTAAAILGLMDSTKVSELLGMVFGSAAGGTGKTLIGEMFRHFNSAILAVASILMTYNLFTGVAESTYHGEFLGKRHSTVWVPVRLPVAAAMMFPTTNGLSAIQLLMIKLALLGSATGDWMWSKTTAAIYEDGVPVVVQPAPRPQGLAEGLFINHLCKHVVNINEVLMTRGSAGPITTTMVAPEGGAIQLLQKSTNPRYYRSCGSATVEVPAKTAGGTDISALRGVHQAALQAMSDRMNKVALDFAYITYPGDLTEVFGAKTAAMPDVVGEINAANDAYTSAVEKGLATVRQQVRAAEAGGKAKANSMASQGWTMAGAYYLDLIKANMAGSEIAGITPTDHAIEEINRHLFRFGRGREIELVDNGLDSRHLPVPEVAEIRRAALGELRQIKGDEDLLRRFDALLRKVDTAPPAVIRLRQPEPQPLSQPEPAWRPVLVATAGTAALKPTLAPNPAPRPAQPEIEADFDYIPHERPHFDRTTLQHLIAVAPDTATEAWLRGFLRA